jgi:hypothetical protein
MKKFIENVRQRPPHERREVAFRIAASLTGVIFLGWLATLGFRLGTPAPKTAEQSTFESQLASIWSAFSLHGGKDNTLEVASTSDSL